MKKPGRITLNDKEIIKILNLHRKAMSSRVIEKEMKGKVSHNTISKIINCYSAEYNSFIERVKIIRIDFSKIINYMKLGYSVEKIEKYANEKGYYINKKDLEIARRIEAGEIKIPAKGLDKKTDKYYELEKRAQETGYIKSEEGEDRE